MLSIRDDMLNSCTEIGITKSAVDKEKGRGETERNLSRLAGYPQIWPQIQWTAVAHFHVGLVQYTIVYMKY